MKLETNLSLPLNRKKFRCVEKVCIFWDECETPINSPESKIKIVGVDGNIRNNAIEWEKLCNTKKQYLVDNFNTFDAIWKKRIKEFGYKVA